MAKRKKINTITPSKGNVITRRSSVNSSNSSTSSRSSRQEDDDENNNALGRDRNDDEMNNSKHSNKKIEEDDDNETSDNNGNEDDANNDDNDENDENEGNTDNEDDNGEDDNENNNENEDDDNLAEDDDDDDVKDDESEEDTKSIDRVEDDESDAVRTTKAAKVGRKRGAVRKVAKDEDSTGKQKSKAMVAGKTEKSSTARNKLKHKNHNNSNKKSKNSIDGDAMEIEEEEDYEEDERNPKKIYNTKTKSTTLSNKKSVEFRLAKSDERNKKKSVVHEERTSLEHEKKEGNSGKDTDNTKNSDSNNDDQSTKDDKDDDNYNNNNNNNDDDDDEDLGALAASAPATVKSSTTLPTRDTSPVNTNSNTTSSSTSKKRGRSSGSSNQQGTAIFDTITVGALSSAFNYASMNNLHGLASLLSSSATTALSSSLSSSALGVIAPGFMKQFQHQQQQHHYSSSTNLSGTSSSSDGIISSGKGSGSMTLVPFAAPTAEMVHAAATKACADQPPWVHWSKTDIAPQLKVVEGTNRLQIQGALKGYRMARASHGVSAYAKNRNYGLAPGILSEQRLTAVTSTTTTATTSTNTGALIGKATNKASGANSNNNSNANNDYIDIDNITCYYYECIILPGPSASEILKSLPSNARLGPGLHEQLMKAVEWENSQQQLKQQQQILLDTKSTTAINSSIQTKTSNVKRTKTATSSTDSNLPATDSTTETGIDNTIDSEVLSSSSSLQLSSTTPTTKDATAASTTSGESVSQQKELPPLAPPPNIKVGGHVRVGWSMRTGELQAPVGYDKWSYAIRDVGGSIIHRSQRQDHWGGMDCSEPGTVIGCMIAFDTSSNYGSHASMIPQSTSAFSVAGTSGNSGLTTTGNDIPSTTMAGRDTTWESPINHIRFFKNGVCMGQFYTDPITGKYTGEGGEAFWAIESGTYYPAVSCYMGGAVRANFGPHWIYPPTSTFSTSNNNVLPTYIKKKLKPVSSVCPPPLPPDEAVANYAVTAKQFRTKAEFQNTFKEAVRIEAEIQYKAYQEFMNQHLQEIHNARKQRNLPTHDLPLLSQPTPTPLITTSPSSQEQIFTSEV